MTKMEQEQQQFLNDLEKKLWNSADKLRSNLDAAVYKHVVLGLVFLKYVSNSFDQRREQLKADFINPAHQDYLAGDEESLLEELEDRDAYTEANVFWVPEPARWHNLQDSAKLSLGSPLPWGVEFKGVGKLLDDAMEAIEKDNSKLKNILNKDYGRLQLDSDKLAQLIDLIATIPFNHDTMSSKDILGHIYEYFLGEFASAEGKRGGQFYTPKSIVTTIVECLQPYNGRVYDPSCGSGGFFISSEKFIEEHGGKIGQVSIYGQESNPTTWRLAAMNMVIRGIEFNLGKEPADTLNNDQHPDLRADFIMANPPFNQSEWGGSDDDKRWTHGIPPKSNANFAWMQHMLYHLNGNGSMGLLLANGSMSSNTKNEGEIRKALIEGDLIECMVALPGQLFTNTQIPACIWFLTKNKQERNNQRNRQGETLFIDARNLGYMKDRALKDFTKDDIQTLADTFHHWQQGKGYQDEAGFCFSAKLADIKKHDYVLTPGRYVGAVEVEEDGEPIKEKLDRLTTLLNERFAEGRTLEDEIQANLRELRYEE
jgi:type I restriction enzyme M protein